MNIVDYNYFLSHGVVRVKKEDLSNLLGILKIRFSQNFAIFGKDEEILTLSFGNFRVSKTRIILDHLYDYIVLDLDRMDLAIGNTPVIGSSKEEFIKNTKSSYEALKVEFEELINFNK